MRKIFMLLAMSFLLVACGEKDMPQNSSDENSQVVSKEENTDKQLVAYELPEYSTDGGILSFEDEGKYFTGKFAEENINKENKEIVYEGEKYVGTYVNTIFFPYDVNPRNIYKATSDKGAVEFHVDSKTGDLVHMGTPCSVSFDENTTDEEEQEQAEELAAKYIDITKYTVSGGKEVAQFANRYKFVWQRKIGDAHSISSFVVTISDNGEEEFGYFGFVDYATMYLEEVIKKIGEEKAVEIVAALNSEKSYQIAHEKCLDMLKGVSDEYKISVELAESGIVAIDEDNLGMIYVFNIDGKNNGNIIGERCSVLITME